MNINELVFIWIGIAVLLFPLQLFFTAPYGRHSKTSWGPMIENKWGWVIMELFSPVAFLLFFFKGGMNAGPINMVLLGIWLLHYLNRSLIFPFRLKTKAKKIPIMIVVSAAFFNIVNGGLNGYFLGWMEFEDSWLVDPRFISGFIILALGVYINLRSDNVLIKLRRPSETGYKIPRGFLFEKVSCPNHLGEIIQWAGFALMAWNPAALSFAIWTFSNLVPRALSHHKWYQSHFAEYPKERKALLPYLI